MRKTSIASSVILNAPFLSATTTDALATPVHMLPTVVPGRYSNASSKALVEVILVDAAGVHFQELTSDETDPSIMVASEQVKSMNTAVFALSHHPV